MRWLAILSLTALVACSTVNVTPYQELNFAPTTEVEVLQEEPTRSYEILAEMWVPANDNEGVLKMRQKGREIGADAIVLIGERNAGAIAIPLPQGGGAVAAPVNRSYAVAVRYER